MPFLERIIKPREEIRTEFVYPQFTLLRSKCEELLKTYGKVKIHPFAHPVLMLIPSLSRGQVLEVTLPNQESVTIKAQLFSTKTDPAMSPQIGLFVDEEKDYLVLKKSYAEVYQYMGYAGFGRVMRSRRRARSSDFEKWEKYIDKVNKAVTD